LILNWDLSYILLSAEIDVFYEFWINLDYSRAKIAAAARQWPMKLYMNNSG